MPKFAAEELGKGYRVSPVFLDERSKASFPGLDAIRNADVLFVSARRHPLPHAEIDLIKN